MYRLLFSIAVSSIINTASFPGSSVSSPNFCDDPQQMLFYFLLYTFCPHNKSKRAGSCSSWYYMYMLPGMMWIFWMARWWKGQHLWHSQKQSVHQILPLPLRRKQVLILSIPLNELAPRQLIRYFRICNSSYGNSQMSWYICDLPMNIKLNLQVYNMVAQNQVTNYLLVVVLNWDTCTFYSLHLHCSAVISSCEWAITSLDLHHWVFSEVQYFHK